ncbi:hypothetical protein, partial [Stutzerimonas balearica]|uniref:hypothetical protein n=1 Tax=Stutzerimonas balearica TaxID=74829 RepID=UPI0022B00B61
IGRKPPKPLTSKTTCYYLNQQKPQQICRALSLTNQTRTLNATCRSAVYRTADMAWLATVADPLR